MVPWFTCHPRLAVFFSPRSLGERGWGEGFLSHASIPPPAKVKEFRLLDIRGKPHTPAEWRGKKAVVLFFLGTECPVSNSYAPIMEKLFRCFGPKGVAFYGDHPDPDVTAAVAAQHAVDYHLTFLLLDPTQVLAKQTKVDVVPEAGVLSPAGVVLYRDQIDDRYSLDGRRRQEPRVHDVADALTAVLAGRQPARQRPAFGCPLPATGKGK
jgi:peroxiredoxin